MAELIALTFLCAGLGWSIRGWPGALPPILIGLFLMIVFR